MRRPLAEQREPKWLIVYGILVVCVVCISLARALAFFEATFRYTILLIHSTAMILNNTCMAARVLADRCGAADMTLVSSAFALLEA